MTLTIGALRAEPGQKTRGSLPADLGTTTVDVPLILVNGSRPGPNWARLTAHVRIGMARTGRPRVDTEVLRWTFSRLGAAT